MIFTSFFYPTNYFHSKIANVCLLQKLILAYILQKNIKGSAVIEVSEVLR